MTVTYAIECPYCKEYNGVEEKCGVYGFERIVECSDCGHYFSVIINLNFDVKKADYKIRKGKQTNDNNS